MCWKAPFKCSADYWSCVPMKKLPESETGNLKELKAYTGLGIAPISTSHNTRAHTSRGIQKGTQKSFTFIGVHQFSYFSILISLIFISFFITFFLLVWGLVCSFSFRCLTVVSQFIKISSFSLEEFTAMDFPLCTTLASSHNFSVLFSFTSKWFYLPQSSL